VALFYRPVKQQLTLRLDADVVAWFKRHTTFNEGYQTRINRALREYVQGQGKQEAPISGLRSAVRSLRIPGAHILHTKRSNHLRKLHFRSIPSSERCSTGACYSACTDSAVLNS
jgi:hypothetical protein